MIIIHPFWSGKLHTIFRQMTLFGQRIVYNKDMPIYVSRWEFPKYRFIEYETSDEKWCRYFGIGKLVDTKEPVVYWFEET